ncbi:secretin N-terminal domain-containing protein [Paraburkholderia sp. BCC1885]|uniref:secretin N-terminal domain-containing protein n=1 Tax=Paraburkholderia sp. BCC1885 TaxID=2562669 RepID=UPI0011833D9E|nr:secretin N-terminal domain-containing protein [Paraburkholderia sp. BCC1885]
MNLLLCARSAGAAALAAACVLGGCAIPGTHREEAQIGADARSTAASQPASRPVVSVHEGAWLMGQKLAANEPQPAIFDTHVVFNDSAPSLENVADWIAQSVGVRAVVDASAQSSAASSASLLRPGGGLRTSATVVAQPGQSGVRPDGLTGPLAQLPVLPQGLATRLDALPVPMAAQTMAPVSRPLRYEGTLRGFLDVVDTRFGVWSHYRDGILSFYRTETRTFTVPSLPDASSMSGSISTGDSDSGQGSGSASGPQSSAGGGSGGTFTLGGGSDSSSSGSGGQTIRLSVQASPWANLEKTALAIAGPGAQVVADSNLDVVTVTGTPPQCDRIAAWIKGLNAIFNRQIAIDVHVYQVQLNQEDNYGVNLGLAYQSAGGHTGVTVTGASIPLVSSNASPMTLGASILGGRLGGTQVALQALSTLGNVSQLVARSGVTQNGKLLALQAAKQQGYVASTQTTLATSVGSSTSMQTATLVPGFTSSFLPRLVGDRILIAFDMTLSDLLGLQTFTSGTGTGASSVQLPTMQITRFEQSVSLRPGETLVLTGMRQQSDSVTNNGIGSPYMALLGGGVDAQTGDTIIAVVISARLL